MTDREMLELAAKAAGREPCEYDKRYWNPLTDDGDALRLAVKLDMLIGVIPDPIAPGKSTCAVSPKHPHELSEAHGDDPYAATRRAITRAAAEVGKAMP